LAATRSSSACRNTIFSFDFFFSSRRRHTRSYGDWSSDVCSSDLVTRVRNTSEVERQSAEGQLEKRGIFTGAYAINPFNRAEVPRSEERRVGKECRARRAREN